MPTCPQCRSPIPDAQMRFCGYCGAKLDRREDGILASMPNDATGTASGKYPPSGLLGEGAAGRLRDKEDERREREERDRRKLGVIAAILWFVLPVTFGCVAAAHGLSFWLGFFLGALANGVLCFLWRPLGF